jgi:hypothetical protein
MKAPSSILVFTLVVAALIFLYCAVEIDKNFAYAVIAFVVPAAAAVVMSPQIDWWWYSRNPRDVAPEIAKIFEQHLPFYQRWTAKEQLNFRQRVDLYLMSVEFIVPSKDEEKSVPDDLRHWVAACAILTTFGKKRFINEKYEKIVAYMKPFPSPQYPQHLHTTESFEEDGVLLFALEPMLHAILQPTLYFNPVLYEYCKIFQQMYWSKNPEVTEEHWGDLEKISGFSREQVYATIELPTVEVKAVAYSYFLLFPERFNAVLPAIYKDFEVMYSN